MKTICERLTSRLGFQKQSMLNQEEHIEALWESFLRRYEDPKQAMEALSGQLLATQRSWREKVWMTFLKPHVPVEQVSHPLRDVCLFWLIWGELGNLRFCPELLCFLFTAACELCDSSSEAPLVEAAEGSFLDEVVKPAYGVMVTETFELRPNGVPAFKFGKAPAPARNYDDWNELFWDPWRLKHALKIKTPRPGVQRFVDACQDSADVWRKLRELDWEHSLRKHKTHLEFHSHFPLLIGDYRIFLLHSVFLCTMVVFWVQRLGRLEGLGARLWRDYGWLFQASLGLVAPAWMLLFQIGFQAMTPSLAKRNRLRGLVQLLCVDFLPVISFAALLWQHHLPDGVSTRFRYIPFVKVPTFDVLLVTHVFFSVFTLVVSLGPRPDNLYRWKFYPAMSRPDCIPSGAFWLFTVALWSIFASSGTWYCGQALLRIWDVYDSLSLPLPYLLAVLTILVIVPTLLVFFSSLCFFLTFSISIVGSMVGAYRLGGVRLMCTRRGMGLTYVPETMVGCLLHLPPHPSRETGLWERFSWWRRMSDPELEAFVDVWNKLLKELRDRDLVCGREVDFLSFRSAQDAFQGNVPGLFKALSALSYRATLPSNGEARRRIVSLARSLQMHPLPKAKVREMPTLSVVIPHYSETIRYSKKDLFSDGETKVSNDLLRFLIKYYRDEFRNFIERLEQEDCSSLEDALCTWASLRMQTLWRTVDGICGAYANALEILAHYQEIFESQRSLRSSVRQRLQVLVAMQQYAKFADPESPGFSPNELQAVEAMFSAFGDFLSIAYIEEQVVEGEKRFFSCLIDSSCEQIPIPGFDDVFARRAKYRIELPGFPILGHGKSDNQNCAVIFTRGEILQMIDANQDAYYEASLFLPSALQEFCEPERTSKGRPGIVGFREHIFSAVGLLGRIAADSEFTFGTMIQRTLDWPLNSRFHYGHPDLMDKLQVVQQGGVSKATRGLNLSEDIFAGLDLSLRGGWTTYREYFHVGKGRDMGFMSVLSFYAKVSMGNAEQAITRQWMRLGLHLELSQLLGIFYSHIGFYMNQALVNRATKAFCFSAAIFALSAEVQESFSILAVEEISSYFGYFYLLFVLASMLPFAFEVMLEEGGLQALWSLTFSLLALSPVFSSFQSKLMGYFFETTLNYGGAQYIPTGRGLATRREPFLKSFRCFAASHMYDALEVVLFIIFSAAQDYGTGFYFCTGFSATSWLIAPFLFNPRQFESMGQSLSDFREWMTWMTKLDEKEEVSWYAWQVSLQEVRRNKFILQFVIGNCRFLAALCTLGLVVSVHPFHSLNVVSACLIYLPCLSHLVVCLFLSIGFSCKASGRVPYILIATLAVVLTLLEIAVSAHLLTPAVIFHKYILLRWMLETADGLAANPSVKAFLPFVHDACRLWAFSWRFLRDMALGVPLALLFCAMTCIPCLNSLHTLFLFHTRRPKEEGLVVEDADENGSSTHLVDPDPIRNFFRTFAPESSVVVRGDRRRRKRPTGRSSLRATQSEPNFGEQEELT